MSIVFFIPSIVNANLIKNTIHCLREKNYHGSIFVIPLNPQVDEQISVLDNNLFTKVDLKEITENPNILFENLIQEDPQNLNKDSDLGKIIKFLKEKEVRIACFGIPSDTQTLGFQIAKHLDISFLLVSDFMFRPSSDHKFFSHLSLLNRENCYTAVPTQEAKKDFVKWGAVNSPSIIGHLSIDEALKNQNLESSSQLTRTSLSIKEGEKSFFVSGSTQPIEIEIKLLEQLFEALLSGDYENVQIRMGIHPGVHDLGLYLEKILEVCEKYPNTKDYFKLILRPTNEEKLKKLAWDDEKIEKLKNSPYISCCDISGSAAAKAADGVAQCVCRALY